MSKTATEIRFPNASNPIEVIDMHTGGEPLRIITKGYPPVPGTDILAKRRYVRENLDHLRKFLMFEPRGHRDMYGALLVEPSLPDADLAVLFLHNEGYSTMCGHAIIALGRYAVDFGLVAKTEPVSRVNIECPCGLVRASVEVTDGKSGNVTFSSVPSFLFGADYEYQLPDGTIAHYDIAYGGAFYVLADAGQFGLSVQKSGTEALIKMARLLCLHANAKAKLHHPEHDDLAFLYGAILTDGNDANPNVPTANICIFADEQVDRSPTGSGVSARLAAQFAKGHVTLNRKREFESVIGSKFVGEVEAQTTCGSFDAIIARVSGKAHYSGQSQFWLDDDDGIGLGFQLG
ncbi:proline racemase family protein [Thalassospira marina]|nr:proline racemase family protein [Thalassospira marina]